MKKNLLERIRHLEHLPQLSQVMLRILDLCQQDDADRDALIQLISSDPALTARLMQLLGSAWINLDKEIRSIESAILFLGIAEIKNLALSMAVLRVFDTEKLSCHFNLNAFWTHSFKTALLCQKLAVCHENVDPNEAYLAGLMHDIGKLVFMANFPEIYDEILKESHCDAELAAHEHERFSMTHAEVGSWLCRKWRLSSMISDAVLYVQDTQDRIAHAAYPLVKVVFAANQFYSLADPDGDNGDRLRELVHVEKKRLISLMDDVDDAYRSLFDSLGMGISDSSSFSSFTPQSLCVESKSDTDLISEELFGDALNEKVRAYSLLYGTLETLLNAGDIPGVLKALEMGIKILFGASTILYFLVDEAGTLLTGCGNSEQRNGRAINSIALSCSNPGSLLVTALNHNEMRHRHATENGESSPSKSMSDEQIHRLLGTDVMFALPMVLPEKKVGVIVIGIDQDHAPMLIQQSGMLTILAKLAATAVDHHLYRTTQPALIQKERAGAASDAMGKVIHEINNPLLIISSYLKMLSIKLPKTHPAQNELAVIDDEIGRIGELVKCLSPFAKPPIREFEWLELHTLFNGFIEMVKQSILTPKGIAVKMAVGPHFPKIKSDGNALKQIVINLMKNAAESMTSGGKIYIVLRQVPGSEKVMIDEMKKRSGAVEIVVEDTGPGIPEDIMEHLFEPYHRSTRKDGSGLGLSIVSTLVKSINGKITCKSRKNRGTKFIIQLPVTSSPAP